MFEFSDAWFLTSLIKLNEWSTMDEIIVAGDVLNHAIFNQEEIDNALEKLIPPGYIETCEQKYRATEKSFELANCSAYKRAGMFAVVDVILKRLNKT
jgi:hypothetical protein